MTNKNRNLNRLNPADFANNGIPSSLIGDPRVDVASMVNTEIGDYEDGDFEDGDFEDGDGDESGDPINAAEEFGDGDSPETGGLGIAKKIRKARLKRTNKKITRLQKRQGKLNTKLGLDASRAQNGQVNSNDDLQFVSGRGVKIQSIDLFPNDASFKGRLLKGNLDRCQLETPGVVLVVNSSTPAVEFGSSYNAASYYLYAIAVIKLGVAALSGVANQTITIVAKVPALNGTRQTVTIQAQIMSQFDGTVTIFPFQIVQGKPVYVYGKAGGVAALANDFLVTITGLPSGAVASLLLPYSEHPLFKKLQSKASL